MPPLGSMALPSICRAADNAMAESFFQLLKQEQVRHRKYRARMDARRDVLSTSICSTTPNASTRTTACCRPSAMITDITNSKRQVS